MKDEIKEYIRSCHICQIVKPQRSSDIPIEAVHSVIPFHTVHLDFGELTKKTVEYKKTRSFLLLIDEATRMVAGKAMKENTRSIIQFLNALTYVECIKCIVSDNGAAFSSKNFLDWANSRGIWLKKSSPYHPSSNGLVERKMRDIKQFIKLYETSQGTWKSLLNDAIRHSNRSFNSSIGCTPLFKLTGKPTELPADHEFSIKADSIEENHRKSRKYPHKGRSSKANHDIHIGDRVIVRMGNIGKRRVRVGPFIVTKVIHNQKVPKTIIYKNEKGRECVAHISNVFKYQNRRSGFLIEGRCSEPTIIYYKKLSSV